MHLRIKWKPFSLGVCSLEQIGNGYDGVQSSGNDISPLLCWYGHSKHIAYINNAYFGVGGPSDV